MAFILKDVVPWGRNFTEYRNMFDLVDRDLNKKIISFGDGPASFNFEMKQSGRKIISIDPIYKFSKDQLQKRIYEAKNEIIRQTRKNIDNYIWENIRTIEDLEKIRMQAMLLFIEDFDTGKSEGRYVVHELPLRTEYSELQFDLGLSSHFLILYSQLGLEFHIQSITEMLRICKEIRIFPILNLNSKISEVLNEIIEYFKINYQVQVIKVNYEFQKNGNEMLKIRRQ
jgi:hypothetical protein